MVEASWRIDRTATQEGRVAVITGSNTGIGYAAAHALAGLGATVVLACRDQAAARAAADRIAAEVTAARVHTVSLDLGSVAAIARCAEEIRTRWPTVDLLINNAGVMAAHRDRTADGFESDFGINVLGPFAFTAQLVDAVRAAPAGRVVTVSSITHRHRRATLDFADLNSERSFVPALAYARSKMAGMVFTFELDRRLRAAGARTVALAAHPGGVRTSILREQRAWMRLVYNPLFAPLTGWFTQNADDGARPVLRAALDPGARGGDFFGPAGFAELVGPPVPVRASARARDPEIGIRLWKAAEDLTGVRFPLAAAGAPPASET
ncbi:oxidoreductase [Nocardia sp. NPDC003345]